MGAERNVAIAFIINGILSSSFTSSVSKASAKLQALADAQKRLAIEEKRLHAAFINGEASLFTYIGALSQVYSAMSKTKKQREELSAAMEKSAGANEAFAGAKANLVNIAGKMQRLAAPIATAVQKAMHFESAMTEVQKAVNFDSPQQFKTMQNDILKLSQTLPISADGIAQIVVAGSQSGIAKADLLSFAAAAVKMGAAFGVTANQAGGMMTKWRTSFQMSQPDVVALADKISYLGKHTDATAAEISDVVTRVGPLGAAGAAASGEIAALSASLAEVGVPSGKAAAGIRNLILGMNSGKNATKSQAEAFLALGLNAADMASRMQTDAGGAILDLMQAVQALDKNKQADVMKNLLGSESAAAIAPLLSNLEALGKKFNMTADSANYAGNMQKSFEAQAQTVEGSLQLAENAVAALAITLGSVFLPPLAQGLQILGDLVSAIVNAAQAHPELTQAILYTAGVIGGMLLAYQGTVLAMAAYQKGMAAINVAQNTFGSASKIAAAGQWLLNAAMTANPVGLLVAGIVALIAMGYALYANWDVVKQFFTSLWESSIAAALDFMDGPITLLLYTVSVILANWEVLKQWFVTLWTDPGLALEQFIQMICDKFNDVINWLGEKWSWIQSLFGAPIRADVQASASGKGETQVYASGKEPGSNARGGIYRKGAFLTTFAERSAEAAIPLDGSARAVSLWQQAGEMLGVRNIDQNAQTVSPAANIASVNQYRLAAFTQQARRVEQGIIPDIEVEAPGGAFAEPSGFWRRGQKMVGAGRTGNAVTATFAPQIHIAGNADAATTQQIQQVLRDTLADFESKLTALQSQKARVSYA